MTQSQTNAPADDRGRTHQPITFYSKTGCPWCNAVRHLLNEHDLSYDERDIRRHPQHRVELMERTRQAEVPTLKIGDEWLIDTDAKKVARHLKLPEPAQEKMAA
jgi:glutaredoxin